MEKTGLEFAAKTDTGLVRSQNEDAVAFSPEYGFALLADGMGGYNAGEVASNMAITVVRRRLEEALARIQVEQSDASRHRARQIQQSIADAMQQANTAILEAAREQQAYSGMGTTLVTAVFHLDRLIVAHVGDSRAYRYRDGVLEQITRDHSLLQEQIDAGLVSPEWARFSQNRNLVTRAVGVAPTMDVELHDHQTRVGDIFLLCSDGLSDLVQDQEIRDLLSERQHALEEACDALVRQANDNGGVDNISVILIRVTSIASENKGLLGRMLDWVS